MKDPLVLASRSPRRRDLLTMLGIPHEVRPVEIDERPRNGESPSACATRLAREKAGAGAAAHPGRWVLAADTLVVLDGVILGKPGSPAEAEHMLARLAGHRHVVVTAVALARDEVLWDRRDETAVWMRASAPDEIRAYVATGEPLDKAGAYGIQGYGSVLVDRIEGDYFGVMGLPVRLVVELLAQAGVPYTFTS